MLASDAVPREDDAMRLDLTDAETSWHSSTS
jgi:hypothetical protein